MSIQPWIAPRKPVLFGNFSRTEVSQSSRKEFLPKLLNPNILRSIGLSAMVAGLIQKSGILPVHGGRLTTLAVLRPRPSVPPSFPPLIVSSSKMWASEFDYTRSEASFDWTVSSWFKR